MGHELAGESTTLEHLAGSVVENRDLAAIEEQLLRRSAALWSLAFKCSEWQAKERSKLADLAESLAEQMKR
jgi:hypothetical protein